MTLSSGTDCLTSSPKRDIPSRRLSMVWMRWLISGSPGYPTSCSSTFGMPNMNGYAFLEHRSASQKLREIPVIVISAPPHPAWIRFPIAGVLTKPVDLVALLLMMRRESHNVAQRTDAGSRARGA